MLDVIVPNTFTDDSMYVIKNLHPLQLPDLKAEVSNKTYLNHLPLS